MTEAEKLFNETHARWIYAWSVILGFRSSFTGVAENVAKQLHVQSEALLRGLTEDPQMKHLLISEPGAERCALDPKLAKVAAQGLLTQNYGSLDAATLVFFHSVLDGITFDYCRVIALHAPQDWEDDLKNAQVPLHSVKDSSYDLILRDKLRSHMERLERESLLLKVDRLFAKCQPPQDWSPIHGYVFDRRRLEAFDEQRHAIIHRNALGKPLSEFPASADNVDYISRTGNFLMGLVNFKYKLRIQPDFIGKFWQQA